MSKRQLVVLEADPNDAAYGAMFGLDPARGTGIPLPAFRSGPTLPPTGSLDGEAFMVTTSRTGFVWTNGSWYPIAPSPVITYPNEAALLADNAQPAGTYAAATDTGNLFIRSATGWRMVGIRAYPTYADLVADVAADGSVGLVLADDSLWVHSNGKWLCQTVRQFPDLAGVTAWTPPDGAEAIAVDTGIAFSRAAGAWYPKSVWLNTEAVILATTNMLKGQLAVATDTSHTFTFDGTAWAGSPVRYYATESTLLASSPPSGVIALADDTGLVFSRTAAGWRRINAAASVVAAAAPSNPAIGEIWSKTTGDSKFWNGTQWVSLSGEAIGTVKMWPKIAPPADFLLCDGSAIPAQYPALIALIGPKTPDLRGQFVRGASTQAEIDGFAKHQWTTGRPRQPFTADQQGKHKHDAGSPTLTEWCAFGAAAGNQTGASSGVSGGRSRPWTSETGAHGHTITGGGDTETAPDHVRLAYIIRAA